MGEGNKFRVDMYICMEEFTLWTSWIIEVSILLILRVCLDREFRRRRDENICFSLLNYGLFNMFFFLNDLSVIEVSYDRLSC